MKIIFRIFFALVIFLIGFGYKTFVLDYEAMRDFGTDKTILIPKGSHARSIERLLVEEGVLKFKDLFYYNVRLRGLGPQLRAGEYIFPRYRSTKSVVLKMIDGDVVYHRLTIPEGLTSREILPLFKAHAHIDSAVMPPIPEGSLLAETYSFSRQSKATDIIKDAMQDLTKFMDQTWHQKSDLCHLTSKEDVLILASIVEKETAIPAERPRIAAVFLNRLKKGMKLQTDPTVIYGIEQETGKEFNRDLLRRDLAKPTPYNTYVIQGLPPTPICHVGKEAITAVLQPLKTDDLFFVADGTGGHIFSKTYKEHSRNHQAWRVIRAKKRAAQKLQKK